MNDSSLELRVRTFRIADGAHLLSLTGDHSACPTLREALSATPPDVDLMLNLDGLAEASALDVLASLLVSPRVRASRRRVIVVCRDAGVRSLFELSGLDRLVLLEHSVDDALAYFVGQSWLRSLVRS